MKELLSNAILLAAQKHRGQFDQGGMPYILHPLAVMIKLRTEDHEKMAIAVLHDVVEDCGVTYDDLWKQGFGQRVVEGVRGMTKVPGESVNENLLRMMKNPDVVDVKLEDLDHNMDPKRMKGLREKDSIRMNKYMYMYRLLSLFKRNALQTTDWNSEYGAVPWEGGNESKT